MCRERGWGAGLGLKEGTARAKAGAGQLGWGAGGGGRQEQRPERLREARSAEGMLGGGLELLGGLSACSVGAAC